jgi:hypothetical protein
VHCTLHLKKSHSAGRKEKKEKKFCSNFASCPLRNVFFEDMKHIFINVQFVIGFVNNVFFINMSRGWPALPQPQFSGSEEQVAHRHCVPEHRVHRVATAAFWFTFHHEGKIRPGWCGWGVHAHPLSLYLPSPVELQCTLQLSGQTH